jgi:predicted nucleotide-binding protein (sugar kinase/HSP70/actin superfamily)
LKKLSLPGPKKFSLIKKTEHAYIKSMNNLKNIKVGSKVKLVDKEFFLGYNPLAKYKVVEIIQKPWILGVVSTWVRVSYKSLGKKEEDIFPLWAVELA